MSEELSIIVAYDRNRLIGSGNELPWYLPADLRHFKELTTGNTVIMGRKTLDSIMNRLGKPLPNRKNVILTKQSDLEIEGCEVVHSMEEAITMSSDGEIFVIGGAQIYHLAMPIADRLIVTEVNHEFEGDTYFPIVNADEWREVAREDHSSDEDNRFDYSFIEYERIR
jgi:dihydrofolate reductase